MGVVYQAIQINTQTVCAIKVFFFKHNDVAKEASILSKIDHPNVCQLLGWSEHHSLPYICIELVTGQTIDELVNQRGKLNALETARFVREIALGLQTIHDLEIIHFDVTTKNIVISNIGVPCLIDFGLATRTPEGADTLPFQAIGTFQFMPPEMLDRRFGEPGKQCDIYSLGVVMYTMLTGYNPFQVLDVDALGQICTHPAPHPNDFENVDIDPELESICLKTLQKHVHNRTSGTRQLIGELDAWIEKANSSA
jgi:serine/threonine-protein kinase